jgi:hypothetical protein
LPWQRGRPWLHVSLAQDLKRLKPPTVLGEYDKVAHECAWDGVDPPAYLLRLIEFELIDRERRMRRGFDGLAALVQTVLAQDPYSGAMFCFRGIHPASLTVIRRITRR